jgi:hypothetical protein
MFVFYYIKCGGEASSVTYCPTMYLHIYLMMAEYNGENM